MWYAWIKEYYNAGFYTKDDLKVFEQAGYITAVEYQKLVETSH